MTLWSIFLLNDNPMERLLRYSYMFGALELIEAIELIMSVMYYKMNHCCVGLANFSSLK